MDLGAKKGLTSFLLFTGWSVYSRTRFCCMAILMFHQLHGLYCSCPTAKLCNRNCLYRCQQNLVLKNMDDLVLFINGIVEEEKWS